MGGISRIQSINCFSEQLRQKGPMQIFQCLIDLGAKFIEFGGPLEEYIDPIKIHSERPQRVNYKFQYENLEYSLAFSVELGHLYFFGAIDYDETSKNEISAATLLNLAEKIIPMFSFKYGFFDMEGDDHLSEKSIDSARLSKIFWANFFGKPYIEKYGKEFLLSAPGWKKTELSDETIEYVLTESLFTPPYPSIEKDIKEYFAPKAIIKRFKPGPIDY